MGYRDIKIDGSDTGKKLNLNRRLRLIGKYIDLRDKAILDCGCGAGEYVIALFKHSSDVRGLEYNEDKVKKFKSKKLRPESVSVGNIEHMDFRDSRFDFVLLNEVLEHVPNETRALKEIFRVLKKGGFLALFSPNRLYPFETHRVRLQNSGKFLPHYVPFIPYLPLRLGYKIFDYPARNYLPGELRKMVTEIGFTVVDHTFIWQTFENISGVMPPVYEFICPLLRRISFALEKVPLIKKLGVSQVIMAQK